MPIIYRNNNTFPLTAEEIDDNFEYLAAAVTPLEYYGAVGDGVADDFAAIQLAIDAVAAKGGGCVRLGASTYGIGASLNMPAYVTLSGAGRGVSKLVPLAALGDDPLIENTGTSDGTTTTPGIVVRDLTIDCALRSPELWLSQADGTPIADPEADYRVGGCLAPTTFATLSLTVSGGEITAVSITDPGSGYTHIPAVWITGDGYGARIAVTISAGAVATATVATGGVGYTTATAEVAGGGADPTTALYAADRRNNAWGTSRPAVRFTTAYNPIIENVEFLNCSSINITDRGCYALTVTGCHFEDGGRVDNISSCLWSQSYGTPGAGQPFFRWSEYTVFENNTIENWSRSACTFGGKRQVAKNNRINGWGESCFFITDDAVEWRVSNNRATGGFLTDIICAFVEANQAGLVDGNVVHDCDGNYIAIFSGGGAQVSHNTFDAPVSRTTVYPFGPFSERVGFNVGQQPVANAQRIPGALSAIRLTDISGSGNEPKSFIVSKNRITHDAGGAFTHLLTFTKGNSNVIGGVLVEGNDIFDAPGAALYDATAADTCLNRDARLVVKDNIGANSASRHVRRLSSALSLVNGTSAQPWFSTNGSVTVRGKTTYRFKGLLYLVTGTTAHDIQLSFGGTATLTSIRYRAIGQVGAVSTAATTQSSVQAIVATAVTLLAGVTGTRKWIEVEGVVEIDAGGTFIPQITFSADPTGTLQSETNSFFEIEQVGIAGMTYQGEWG